MQRTEKILDLLSIHKTMSVHQLCDALFCSVSSLRRDLIALEKTGSIRRIRGGAALVIGTTLDYSSTFREANHIPEKEYICEIARDFLTNGMSLFLDPSSTVSKICPTLETLRDTTVITNGISTASILNNYTHITTFMTGGQLKPGSSTLMGVTSINCLSHMKADLALISCRGIDCDGAYEADIGQAEIKQHMIANSKKTLLLVDDSKFESHYLHRLCHFNKFHAVITNKKPPYPLKQAIEKYGCEVLY